MFDEKIISMYQWIVDTTERKPNWLGEQVIWPSVAIDLVHRAVAWKGLPMDWFMTFLIIAVGAALIMAARSEPFFKSLGKGTWIRTLFVALLAFHIGGMLMVFDGTGVLRIASTMLVGSYYYFAACEAPRPKKRKEKLVLART